MKTVGMNKLNDEEVNIIYKYMYTYYLYIELTECLMIYFLVNL